MIEDREELNISIHIPRVGDDHDFVYLVRSLAISIHIPRVGDDAAGVYR